MSKIRDSTEEYLWAARERISVGATAVGFTAATYKPTTGDRKGIPAKIAKFTVESTDIRWKQDGNDPTSANGKIVYETGSDEVLGYQNIKNFSVISKTGSNATLDVEYGW